MATAITIKGRKITRPGTYSEIKSGITNPALALSYGNVCIIDDGIGAGFGGGAGINGTLTTEAADAIYAFKTIQELRDFVKGGPLWDVAEALFKPAGLENNQINGVSTVYLIRAAQTLNAAMTKTFANGTLVIDTLDEGLNANGVAFEGELINGYGMKIVPGVLNSAKYKLRISVGTFRGEDALNANTPFDGISKAASRPNLIVESPEISTVAELVSWIEGDFEFNKYFRLKSHTVTTTGAITIADLNTSYTLATGATEVYGATDFDKAIRQVRNLDNAFFLATRYGEDALGLSNFKILDFLNNDAKYEKLMYVGGGVDSTKFDSGAGSSVDTATTFDSDRVVVVHGGAKKAPRTGQGFKIKSQFYKTATVLGRTAGLEPQVPITLKTIGIDGEVHALEEEEQEYALSKGVLYSYYDYDLAKYVIGQGITTLQNNEFLVNEDATSFSIAVKRISGQLNKELMITGKRKFFGNENGPNRNTVSSEDIKAWLEGFLSDKTASTLTDNLITRFGNIVVTTNQDNYFVNYEFVPNFEISKIVFTGFILEK